MGKKPLPEWVDRMNCLCSIFHVSGHFFGLFSSLFFAMSALIIQFSILLRLILAKFVLNDKIKWIKVNSDQNGYYRVMYNQENWDGLIAQLRSNHTVLSKKVVT